MNNVMNGMFGMIDPQMCRLTMNGEIAVKTSGGYKSYNAKSNRLTNCTNFCFDVGQEFFFLIPTNKVEPRDIILVNGKPKCVISVDKTSIKVLNYEDSTIEDILPERHVFMGNTYFYGKIVSMFGGSFKGGKNGANNIMKYMMMSQMMSKMGGSGNGNIANMLPFMMMNGGGNMFEGLFDMDFDDDEDNTESVEEVNE